MVVYLFGHLPLVSLGLLGELLDGVVEGGDDFVVFLGRDDQFLDAVILLPQDLLGFGVATLLLLQFDLDVSDLLVTTSPKI